MPPSSPNRRITFLQLAEKKAAKAAGLKKSEVRWLLSPANFCLMAVAPAFAAAEAFSAGPKAP